MWLLYLLSPLDLIPEAVFGLVSRFFAMFVQVICILGWPPGWPCDISSHLHVPHLLLQVQVINVSKSQISSNYCLSPGKSWPIWERTFLLASTSDHLDKYQDLYPIVLLKIKTFFIVTKITGIVCIDKNFTRKKQRLNCAKHVHSQFICKAVVSTSSSIPPCVILGSNKKKSSCIKYYTRS